MTEQEMRLEALRCAVAYPAQNTVADILARATQYTDFIRGTPVIVAGSEIDLRNPIAFIEKCVVLHPTRGPTQLELYEYQRHCIEHINNNGWSIICKARQMGITTIMANYCLWYAQAHPGSTVVIISHKLIQATHFLELAALSADHLTQFGTPRSTKTTLELANGSRILSRAAAPDALRGLRADLIYFDEPAYISHNKGREMWRGIFPYIRNAKLIMASTPNDTEGIFYDQWMYAQQSLNDMAPLKIVWSDNPDRDAAWANAYRTGIGERAWRQEFECDFITREK